MNRIVSDEFALEQGGNITVTGGQNFPVSLKVIGNLYDRERKTAEYKVAPCFPTTSQNYEDRKHHEKVGGSQQYRDADGNSGEKSPDDALAGIERAKESEEAPAS